MASEVSTAGRISLLFPEPSSTQEKLVRLAAGKGGLCTPQLQETDAGRELEPRTSDSSPPEQPRVSVRR